MLSEISRIEPSPGAQARIQPGKNVKESAWVQQKRTACASRPEIALTSRLTSWMRRTISPAWASTCSPARVSVTPRGPRSNISAPIQVSKARMRG